MGQMKEELDEMWESVRQQSAKRREEKVTLSSPTRERANFEESRVLMVRMAANRDEHVNAEKVRESTETIRYSDGRWAQLLEGWLFSYPTDKCSSVIRNAGQSD